MFQKRRSPLFLLLAGIACGDPAALEPPPGNGVTPPTVDPVRVLAAEAGNGQTGTAGSVLPLPIAVRLLDGAGAPVAGAAVSFTSVAGGGTLGGTTARSVATDQEGRAAALWTLGTIAGANRLQVSAGNAGTVEFSAEGVAGPFARIDPANPVSTPRVATTLPPVRVRTVDQYGNAVGGIAVEFALGPEGGTLTGPDEVTSDAGGYATGGRLTLGTRAGAYTIIASAAGILPTVVTFTALPGSPARMVVVEGNEQTATVMSHVAIKPRVRVLDQYDNAVAEPIQIRFWTRDPDDGSLVLGPFQQVHGTGEASVPWQLGRRPGTYLLDVTSGTLAVSFTATAVPGPAARLVVFEGDRQRAPVNSALPVAPAVQVTDIWSNAVSVAGLLVKFRVSLGGGSIADDEQVTDANGVARAGTWTIGAGTADPGNQLVVSSPDLFDAVFWATGFIP